MRSATLAFLLSCSAAASAAAPPETVAVTYRFTRENEAALRRAIEDHWMTVRKLKLVTGPRQFFRGDGFFLEIFTWKDASIPDDAPPEVRKIWARLESLVDRNEGKRALEIEEIHPVGGAP